MSGCAGGGLAAASASGSEDGRQYRVRLAGWETTTSEGGGDGDGAARVALHE